MNLLTNGGFEGGWTRKTHTGVEFGEIFVPAGWTAFWREGGAVPHDPANNDGYGRPEMHVINREAPYLNPPRIHGGQHAVKLFTFYRIHDAGLYQQVTTVPCGSRLRMRGWAHAWTSTHDDPHMSEHDGDAAQQATFRVGIDPGGGTDPWGVSVIWGPGANLYDVYGEIPPIEVVAQADMVTVFVRSTMRYPFKHCDAYLDNMSLEMIKEPSCPGPMPVDYVVVANLLPQDATVAETRWVAEEMHQARQTLVFSADDAARLVAPGLPGSYVRVWEPKRFTDDIVEFLQDHGVTDIREAVFAADEPVEPEPEPEEPDPEITWKPKRYIPTGTVLGWHAIGNCGLQELYAPDLSAPSIKLVQAVGDIGKMPARYRVLRFIDAPRLGNLEGFNYAGNPEAQAEARMAALIPLLGPYAGDFDFAEIINEQAPPTPEAGALLGRFFNRAMELCPSWMRLLLFSLSTGEPADPEPTWATIASTRVLENAAAGGHGISLHAYYDHRVPGDVEWHLLRFRLLYDVHILPKHLDIPLFLTELSPWEHLVEQRSFNLMDWVKVTDTYLRQYPYLAGGHLFTVSDVGNWHIFDAAYKRLYPTFIEWARNIKERMNA